MIELNFHWAWILVAIIVMVGICVAFPYLNRDHDAYGCGAAAGCAILVFAVLVALVIGGIFIW